jgi:ABC-2 type transport system ATP-binding protein
MEAIFQECILTARSEGRTVLLSSHILAQVEVLADRVSIIRQGRTVESGTLRELRHLTRTTITVDLAEPAVQLGDLPGVHGLERIDGQLRFHVDGDRVDETFRALAPLGVRSIVAHPPTLEQLLLRHYGDDLAEHGIDVAPDTDGGDR